MKSISWLEMSLQVPDNWDLVAESGGITEGYMRLDSVERTRLEIKWERTKKRGEAMPLIALDGYVKEATKSVKDKKSIKIIEKGNARVADHKASFYVWEAKEVSFVTTCWLCHVEGKVILLQYYLAPGEDKAGGFEELLRGVECHTSGDFHKYELFGVRFQIPKAFRISKRKLLVGRAAMTFVSGGSTLHLSWLGLAKEQLRKHGTLGRLFNASLASEVREIAGLKALVKKVKDADEPVDLESVSKGVIPFISKPKHNRLKVFLDEGSNKVFAGAYSCEQGNIEGANTFIKTIEAHEG